MGAHGVGLPDGVRQVRLCVTMNPFSTDSVAWRLLWPWSGRRGIGLAARLALVGILAALCMGAGCKPGFQLKTIVAAKTPDKSTGESRFSVSITPTGSAANKGANGFLFQKVIADFKVYKCRDCDCETFKKRSDPSRPCDEAFANRVVYVETWELAGGTLYHGLRSSNDTKPQDTFSTGDFSVERKTEVCGVNFVSGEMKFVSGRPPADLNPANWKPADKARQSGRLPSTLAVATTRAFDALKGSVIKGRELRVGINSCGSPAAFRGSLLVNKPSG